MGNLGTTAGLYAARPILTLGGQERPALAEGLLALVVEETTAGLFRCEATFGNWGTPNGRVGYLYFDRSLIDFGRPLAIRLGDGDAARQIFDGRIMGLEAHYPRSRPPELLVLAEDRF